MKKLILGLFLAVGLAASAAFGQTPCIDAAKKGVVASCLDIQAKVTRADAQFVAVNPIPGYSVSPDLSYSQALEFATKEQALAVIELIKFAAPGSNLVLKDVGPSQSFPPFRELRYFNDGGLFAPRLYEISGTIALATGPLPTLFEPGWLINVERLIYGGSFETQALYPWGKDRLIVFQQFEGSAFPKWVGRGTRNPDGSVTP